MSADETPASRPPTGKNPERTGSASPASGAPQQSAERARAEEARRMRERVHQREMSEGQEPSPSGQASSGQAPRKEPGASSGARGSDPQARATGQGAQRGSVPSAAGSAQPKGRTIASASASVPRRSEQGPAKRPVITGVAAAKLLGKNPQKSAPSSGQKTAGPGATAGTTGSGIPVSTGADERGTGRVERPRKTGGGIDGPTSHIDRSNVAVEEMPDLGRVRHPAPAAETRTEHESHPRTAVTVGRRRGRGPLRAAMQLRSIDPWSALKVSLVLSVAMFLVWMVAVAIIYVVLDGMGVWDRLNTGVSDIISTEESSSALVGPGQVFGVAAILGIINIVLFTALSTLGAFIYNISSDMVGGVEVTLADRD